MSGIPSSFLSSISEKQWRKIGLSKRAGVSTPLFSIYSSKSLGIGEYPDLELLGDWCVKTGMSIIQLLPMNDVGLNFTPYDAASTFALEPMYLRLEDLKDADAAPFSAEINAAREKFPCGRKRVDYGIKKAKLEILEKIFEQAPRTDAFKKFMEENAFWLPDYAVYQAAKETAGGASWENWEPSLRGREEAALKAFAEKNSRRILFYQWLQWQCFLQARAARQKLSKKGVLLMGDLPFLVSRDSADVWAHQSYFKMDLAAGAPPDAFFARGQRWGMPPYDWPKIEAAGYDYLVRKVRYAENFYDLFRIDHVVGTFRLWTIRRDEPSENHGLNGRFDPEDPALWEEHGRKILSVMIRNSDMLPCAEDLGVVPECSNRVLENFGVPGMDVQRWTRDWGATYDFKDPAAYRVNSAAVISNHDMTSFAGWWRFEAGTVDGELFQRKCAEHGVDFAAAREKIFDAARSAHGRLRWKSEIHLVRDLAAAVGKPEHEIHGLAALHRESRDEKEKFCRYLGLPEGEYEGKEFSKLIRGALEKVCSAASVFSIQLMQDLLLLENTAAEDPWNFRINFPGTTGPQNWTLAMPLSMEQMTQLPINGKILEIHRSAGRI